MALFVPLRLRQGLRLVLITSSRRARPGAEIRQLAFSRSLSIRSEEEQGIAGIAFVRGLERDSLYGSLDFNFTEQMKSTWVNQGGYRDWRSVLAVPLVERTTCLPTAVLTITSNLPKPFWTRFEPDHGFRQELLSWMRQTTEWILGGYGVS